MSKIDDSINMIGMEQTLKVMLDAAKQMATYYQALLGQGVPSEAALDLTIALQTAIFTRPVPPGEDV